MLIQQSSVRQKDGTYVLSHVYEARLVANDEYLCVVVWSNGSMPFACIDASVALNSSRLWSIDEIAASAHDVGASSAAIVAGELGDALCAFVDNAVRCRTLLTPNAPFVTGKERTMAHA